MKIALVTNMRAPYRNLQINEFSKIRDAVFNVYYTNKKEDGRTWEIEENRQFYETDLKGYKLSKKYGYINSGLFKLIRKNDLIILGGYEQPSYIIISVLCKIFNKPYVLLFDGICCNKIYERQNTLIRVAKSIVIHNSKAILGNGKVSKEYFTRIFGYDEDRIYNQYLSVDTNKINELYDNRAELKRELRKKLNINEEDRVLIFSGRLIDIKNVENVIKALAQLNKTNLVFLITGGGPLENGLKIMAGQLGVRVIITGFIPKQEELFKHYFCGDALILPSVYDVWGLVVNEAMSAGLPVIVSKICGCSKDLVYEGENGYIIDPLDIRDIGSKINRVLYEDDYIEMGLLSKRIIRKWNFENSRNSLVKLINQVIVKNQKILEM